MVKYVSTWWMWAITFLCACSAAVPALPVQRTEALGSASTVLVIRPAGFKPVDLTREEFKQGMQMLYANGPLPGAPKGGKPHFILTSADTAQMVKAAGYLEHCQHITGKRFDCWDDLNASGGLDDEGATFVALHFALSEALEDAASAVGSMTPAQVRAMMSLMFLGMIVELISPEPVTKFLFVLTATNLIAFVGVDVFNQVVKGFTAMLDDLERARDFEGVRAAGIHYGQRIGPTVARIVVMIATYGVAKFAGLFKGSALSLPGGSRAAALAESQGLPISVVQGARSIALSADGTVAIGLGTPMAMSAAGQGDGAPRTAEPEATTKGRLKAAGLPTSGKIRYVPPETWTPSQPLPRGPNSGYVDRFGNEWVKGPSRTQGQPYEWDVQLGRNATDGMRKFSRDGMHVNVSLDGEVTH